MSLRPRAVVTLLGSLVVSSSLLVAGCAADKGMNEAKDARREGAAPASAPAAPAAEAEKTGAPTLDEAELEEEAPAAEESRSRSEAKPSKVMAPTDAKEKKKEEGKRDALDATRTKDGAADFDDEGDELASLQRQLVSLEGELRQAGVPIPPEGALAGNLGGEDLSTAAPGTTVKCEKACELTEAICGLADNICGLRERHPDDERYVNACERAKGDCQLGKRSCDACSGG